MLTMKELRHFSLHVFFFCLLFTYTVKKYITETLNGTLKLLQQIKKLTNIFSRVIHNLFFNFQLKLFIFLTKSQICVSILLTSTLDGEKTSPYFQPYLKTDYNFQGILYNKINVNSTKSAHNLKQNLLDSFFSAQVLTF